MENFILSRITSCSFPDSVQDADTSLSSSIFIIIIIVSLIHHLLCDWQVSGTGIWGTLLAPPTTTRPVQKSQQGRALSWRPRLKVRTAAGRLFSAGGPLTLFSHSLPMRRTEVTSMPRCIPNQRCRTPSRFMATRCTAGRSRRTSTSPLHLVPQKPLPHHMLQKQLSQFDQRRKNLWKDSCYVPNGDTCLKSRGK